MSTPPCNPARELRKSLVRMRLGGFLRWDTRGRCLLVSDAARRDPSAVTGLAGSSMTVSVSGGLLCFDLPRSAYEALLTAPVPSVLRKPDILDWQTYLLLERILRHPADDSYCDVPLLRAAMLSSAQGPRQTAAFCSTLRSVYAAGLRTRRLLSCRASAALILGDCQDDIPES